MGRRKLAERNIRKLTKVAGGKVYSITLPIEVIREFKWREGQKIKLEIDYNKKTVLIKDWEKK